MRRRLWKRKQESLTEEPPEDGSSVIKSSENNSVQLLKGSGSANNEFWPRNSEFRLVNSKLWPINSEFRPVNSELRRSTVNSDLATVESGHREMISRGLMSITICKN
ncbi:hypothetical protein PIB30_087792, partial [Stylosanthes scabra]|nr:hypothetical protein [Stylosanthes scabra]